MWHQTSMSHGLHYVWNTKQCDISCICMLHNLCSMNGWSYIKKSNRKISFIISFWGLKICFRCFKINLKVTWISNRNWNYIIILDNTMNFQLIVIPEKTFLIQNIYSRQTCLRKYLFQWKRNYYISALILVEKECP